MIQDIEEESRTKFSMDVEFSFSFKEWIKSYKKLLTFQGPYSIVSIVPVSGTQEMRQWLSW